MIKTTRTFTANEGDSSVGKAGPDAIETDIDNLYGNSIELDAKAKALQTEIDNIVAGGTIPLDHSSASAIYGVGTTTKNGHVKVINDLTHAEYTNGEALSAYQGKVLNDVKAQNNHASTQQTYGLGTTANYGHVLIKNDLNASSYTDGQALSAYQGYLLNERNKYKVVELTSSGSWVVPDGVYEIDLVMLGGGGGGRGGDASYNVYYDNQDTRSTQGSGGRGGVNGQLKSILKVKTTPGQVISYIIGAGGIGGIAGIEQGVSYYHYPDRPLPNAIRGGNGTNGGSTSILGFSATGGIGSTWGVGSSNNAEGEYQTNYGYPEILTNARPLSTGGNGTEGGCNHSRPEYNADSPVPTVISGGGNGGRGGFGSLRAASVASNATGYGSGGGGGGGGGVTVSFNTQPAAEFVQSGTAGANGKQGIILIGYF